MATNKLFISAQYECPGCGCKYHTDKEIDGDFCISCKREGKEIPISIVEMTWWDGTGESATRHRKTPGDN